MGLGLKKTLMAAVFASTTLFAGLSASLASAADDELVVYSSRNEELIKPLFDRYTKKSGVKIRYITDKDAPLIARLEAEGKSTPADMLITVDAGNLWQAKEKGILQPYTSETLQKNIPVHLRDPDNNWYGMSVRARTMVYASDRLKPEQLSSYEDLADPKWEGRLCLRTSKKVYNQSLVATMIDRLGEPGSEKVVKGWVHNLAMPVFSNDTKAMEAVASGICDVTIVNTYYFGRLLKQKPDTNLKLFWANQGSSGVHVNVSGAGITRYAKHPEAAAKLLEWMSTPEAQRILADSNMEYPANADVQPSSEVAAWGSFKQDNLNVETAGRLQSEAIQLMDRAKYN